MHFGILLLHYCRNLLKYIAMFLILLVITTVAERDYKQDFFLFFFSFPDLGHSNTDYSKEWYGLVLIAS